MLLSYKHSLQEILLAHFQQHGLTISRSKDKEPETIYNREELRGDILSVTPFNKLINYYNEYNNKEEKVWLSSLTEDEIKNLKGLDTSTKVIVNNYLAIRNWKHGDEIPEEAIILCDCREYTMSDVKNGYEEINIAGSNILSITDIDPERGEIAFKLDFRDEGYTHSIWIYLNINY